jgi:iron complex transport system substrate-binding protein
MPGPVPRRLRILTALAAATVLALTGCGADDPAAPTRPAASPAAGFPVSVTGDNGALTLARPPQRIVSLAPTATEDLFAVGAGKQVVAVDDQSDHPATAPRTKLSGFQPNAEAVAAYRPDLVVLSTDSNGIVAALGKLGIPTLQLDAAKSLDAAYEQLRTLGRATGHPDTAASVVSATQARIAAAVASVPPSGGPRSVYHELDPTYYSARSTTFIGQVYGLFGLRSIADAAPAAAGDYPQLSAEFVATARPDVIVLADVSCCGQSAATLRRRPGLGTVPAVRTGRIVEVDDDIASRWGPRVADLAEAVAAGLRES